MDSPQLHRFLVVHDDESDRTSRELWPHVDPDLPQFFTLSSGELKGDTMTTPTTQEFPSFPSLYSGINPLGNTTFQEQLLHTSLRKEGPPITFYSRHHVGLALTGLASGAAMATMHTAYRPLLNIVLTQQFHQSIALDSALFGWSEILSVLLGLLSDCLPLCKARRKTYIAFGWLGSLFIYSTICFLSHQYIVDTHDPAPYFNQFLQAGTIIGSLTLQVAWVAALALVISFGQRETLRKRGGLAILFLIFWQLGTLGAYSMIACFQTHLTLITTSGALATISALVLPFVFYCLHDEDELQVVSLLMASTKRVGIGAALFTGCSQLWDICLEKVTHRVLFFLLVYGVCIEAGDRQVVKALMLWCGYEFEHEGQPLATHPYVLVFECSVTLVALIHAKWQFLETKWRPLAFTGTFLVVLTSFTQAAVITSNWNRSKWFFYLSTGILIWSKTWILLLTMLSITEVAFIGCEGVTMGLALSFQGLGFATSQSFTLWLGHDLCPTITPTIIHQDAQSVRAQVMAAATVWAFINLLSALAVFWFPRSKLEAQQLRTFGGYSKRGGLALAMTSLVLLVLAILVKLHLV